jgi:hypothetical protein
MAQAVDRRNRAVADLALIAGIDAARVRIDNDNRTLRAQAAPLPGLSVVGYRALEARAARVLPQWNVTLAPPADVALPEVAIDQGVVDGTALDAAAWASLRLNREIDVRGGLAAQRRHRLKKRARGGGRRGGGAPSGMGGAGSGRRGSVASTCRHVDSPTKVCWIIEVSTRRHVDQSATETSYVEPVVPIG